MKILYLFLRWENGMNTKPEIGRIVQFSIENEIFCGVVVKKFREYIDYRI